MSSVTWGPVPAGRVVPVALVAVLLLAVGCGSPGDADDSPSDGAAGVSAPVDGTVGDAGADEGTAATAAAPTVTTAATATTAPPSSTSPVTALRSVAASEDAEAFKDLGPTVTRLPAAVGRFIAEADATRIGQLAANACAIVDPSMTDAELGTQGIELYDQLDAGEQQRLDVNQWVLLFGALLGYFCPEQLPDLGTAAGAVSTIEQFRSVVGTIEGLPAEAEEFVVRLGDERLDRLHRAACAGTDAGMTAEQFGLAIAASYDADLTEGEREAIALPAYSELYGAIVGWFCNENLPL